MAEMIGLSKEQFQQLLEAVKGNQSPDQMQKIVEAAVLAARTLNPLEQKSMDERLALEKRRSRMQVEFGRIEEEAMRRKKFGCSHRRWPQGHKLAGHSCPRGQGEWTTGGQLTGRLGRVATMVCLRCGWTWAFRTTAEEAVDIGENGLLGVAPPPDDRLLSESCIYCNEPFTKSEYAHHDIEACRLKHEDSLLGEMAGAK